MQRKVKQRQQARATDQKQGDRRTPRRSVKRKRNAAAENGLEEDPSPSDQDQPGASVTKQEEDERQDANTSPPHPPAGFVTLVGCKQDSNYVAA